MITPLFGQSKSNFSTASSATLSVTYTNAVASGSTLWCAAFWGNAGQTCTVSDTVNGSWTALAPAQDGSGAFSGHVFQAFYKLNSAAGTPTVTMTCSGSNTLRGLAVHEIIGDITGVEASYSITTPTISGGESLSGTITTTAQRAILCAACLVDNVITGVGSGFGAGAKFMFLEGANFGDNGTAMRSVSVPGTWQCSFAASTTNSTFILFAFSGSYTAGTKKVRFERNILCAPLVAAPSTVATSNEVQEIDFAVFDPGATLYLEIVAKTSVSFSNTVTLRGSGGRYSGVDVATVTIPTSTTTYTRLRSAVFYPLFETTQDFVVRIASSASGTTTVIAARVIIVESPENSSLLSTEEQIEVGSAVATQTNAAYAALTNPKYWTYNSANYDGDRLYFLGVTGVTSTGTASFILQEDDGSFGSWAQLGTDVGTLTTTPGHVITPILTPPTDGRHYRLAVKKDGGAGNYTIYNAKFFVTQWEGGSLFLPNSSHGDANGTSRSVQGGTAGSGQTAQAVAQDFTLTVGTNQITGVRLSLRKIGSPTDNAVVELCTTITGAAIATATLSLSRVWQNCFSEYEFTFDTPLTPSLSTQYFVRVTRSGARDTTNYFNVERMEFAADSPYTGSYRDNNAWVSGEPFCFRLVGSSPLTKHEVQYLFLNAADSGTGKQSVQQLWSSSEFGGVTNTYTYSHDASNAADSSKIVDIDNADADVSGATVTGANQQTSSSFTMPTSGHQLDVNVTNSTGVVAAARILVKVVDGVAAVRRWILGRH